MSRPAVIFDHVSKKYRRGERHDSLRDAIPAFFKRRPAAGALGAQEFWAVEDVSFEVKQGEALGIIGPNGAGKSTTLKLLTKILRPTLGHCEVHGRSGALIEVAAGFHPDLTGRENIFLQGAIMGMRRADIQKRLDGIIDFAGVEAFIDTQVKRYSSGMNARLGFAIAAHLDPEVLIIDEVLSVGDAAFQQKCVQRMREFRDRGVSIVFVSHNLQAVSDLCSQAIFLHRQVKKSGTPDDVISYYTQSTTIESGHESDDVRITGCRLITADGAPVEGSIPPRTPLVLRVTYTAKQTYSDLVFGFIVWRSTDNTTVYHGNHTTTPERRPSLSAGETLTLDFAFTPHLTRGQYHLGCHVWHTPTQQVLARLQPAGAFSVFESHSTWGLVDLDVRTSIVEARTTAAVPVGAASPAAKQSRG
jgi:ABC-type polysaccharide/polyol phosphate transport system ATPase subunit